MPNNRVFYASHGVSIGGTTVQGAQSVGVTTNFALEQAFQLGQLALYDNAVTDPNVEVTVSKVLDGASTIWNLATTGNSLVGSANDTTTVVIAVGDDTAASLTSTQGVTCTGMFVSSLNYSFPVDGPFTEEISFVGNHKSVTGTVSAPSDSGQHVLRRQNFKIGDSTLPVEVSGKNLSNITISADLGRESIYKLGQFAPYHRFVNFPLEITTEITVTATDTDDVPCDVTSTTCTPSGLPTEQQINLVLCDGLGSGYYQFNLGSKNRLQSVNYSGGDTGGGNATITYTYVTYNELSISG